MSTEIKLPPLNITAVSPVFGSTSLGAAPNMPNPGAFLAAMHPKRLHKYGEGYWREVIIKHMVNRYIQNGWRYVPTAELVFDMWKVPLADKYMCLNPHALSAQAINEALHGGGYRKKISDAKELSGGPLTPAAAFFHYLDGSGTDVVTNINRLGLNLSAAKIPALERAIAAAGVGSSPINIAMLSYNTKQDSWLTWTWLGHISLRIEGVVHKNADGSLSFNGVARAYNDIYDFNASTHRSEVGEAATAGGRYLGGSKGKPYQIVIQGESAISIQR